MAEEWRPLGPMLERFAAFHHMEETALAAFLGIAPDGLGPLREDAVPQERSEAFAGEVARIARATGASAARLMQVARVAKLLR